MQNDPSLGLKAAGFIVKQDDVWTIATQLLQWLYLRHELTLTPHVFYTGLFGYNADSKQLMPPVEVPAYDENNLPPAFLSPEETGRIAMLPDYRSDFYRMGIVLYDLFIGRPPFDGNDTVKIIWQHIAEVPPEPRQRNPAISAAASAIIKKLLHKDAAKRYQSVNSLLVDWERATHLKNEGIEGLFELGETDFPVRFTVPAETIGQHHELAETLEFIQSFTERTGRGCLLIEGENGSGKSMLLRHIGTKLPGNNYAVIQGNFADDDKVPFFTLKKAFDDLASLVLNSEIATQTNICDNILNLPGEGSQVLSDFSPAWHEVVSFTKNAPLLTAQETQYRLAFVLANVLSAIAKPEKPLVFLMEDLQLATPQTMRFLLFMLGEAQLQHFVFVATVNTNTGNYEQVQQWFKKFETDTSVVKKALSIHEVNYNQLSSFLTNASIDPEAIDKLTTILLHKTSGKASHIVQLLQTAAQQKCFIPNLYRKHWQVDVQGITTLNSTSNMVALLQEKLAALPADDTLYLQAAATIGLHFDLPTLAAALPNVTAQSLQTITRNLRWLQVILPTSTNNAFKFADPQLITQIAHKTPLNVNQQILANLTNYLFETGNYRLLDIALYTLLGYVVKLQQPNVEKFGQLLQNGATKAEAVAGFDDALQYYQAKLRGSANALPPEQHFTLVLNILRMQVFALRFSEFDTTSQQLRATTGNQLDVAEIDLLECQALLLQQKLTETVAFTLQSLQKLEIIISAEPGLYKIIFSLVKLQASMRTKTVAELEQLPLSTDRRTIIILKILQTTSSAFFLAAPKALPLIAAAQITLSLKKGISETMGQVFASYGFILSAFNKQFKRSNDMFTLAQNLDQRFGNYSGRAATIFMDAALSRHWHSSIAENAGTLSENYHFSRDIGAVQMAFYSLATGDVFKFYSGKALPLLEPLLKDHLIACTDKQQVLMEDFLKMILQFVEDVSHSNMPLHFMEGHYFSAGEATEKFMQQNNHTSLTIAEGLTSLADVIFLRNNNAVNNLKTALNRLSLVGLSSVSLIHTIIFNTILCFRSQKNPLSITKKAHKQLTAWAVIAPYNFGGWGHLINGLAANQNGQRQKAVYELEQAIYLLQQQGILYGAAIACEAKAAIMQAVYLTEETTEDIIRAYHFYKAWGAVLKCAELEKKHPLLAEIRQVMEKKSTDIDMTSLLRASNSIAAEIKWESLLEKLSTILIENTGAQTAQLMVPRMEDLVTIAFKNGQTPVQLSETATTSETHPLSLLRTVRRSLVPQVLYNAVNDIQFANDAYIKKHQTLSVLCVPVVKNKRLLALIYLENNITAGTFTVERLGLVQLLSGQIAVSLENAQLYDELENRVQERTKQLQEKNIEIEQQKNAVTNALGNLQATQEQLIYAEKMASLGELTAGIAHEIQNPLNFINNFSDLNKELLGEIKEALAKNDMGNLTAMMNDLYDNEEKITHHGKRADSIVKAMLQHSRISAGHKTPVNINALADEYLRLSYHGLRAKDKTFNATFKTHFDDTIETILAVGQDIGRVLLNLYNNAFYAVFDKKKQLAGTPNYDDYHPLVMVTSQKAGDYIKLMITDNGNGIPTKVKDKIFQPFFTTKPTGEGTGLGLSLSYDIVKAHGGEIKVTSTEGEGTTFELILVV